MIFAIGQVLIGCDGINSVVAKWLGFKEASFTGRYVIRGDIKLMNNHGLQPNFMHFFGKGFRSGVLPCDETTVYWFFTWTPTTEGEFFVLLITARNIVKRKIFPLTYNFCVAEKELVKNPGKMKRLVLEKCEKMPSHMRCFIEKTEAEDILTSPLRYRKVWELVSGNISKGNVCVVGDAYHPMAPDLGQGGCCSLEDGIVLGRCLAQAFCKKGETEEQYKEIEACLRKYEKERRWRNIDISVTSYVLGFLLQGDLKFLAHVRDKVLPHFLAGLLLNKSDFDCGKLNTSD